MKLLQDRHPQFPDRHVDTWLLRLVLVVIATYGSVQIAFAVKWWLS